VVRKINNLRAINSGIGFDSHPGHHILIEYKHLGAPLKNRYPIRFSDSLGTLAYPELIEAFIHLCECTAHPVLIRAQVAQ
jgi:hypothetical protein